MFDKPPEAADPAVVLDELAVLDEPAVVDEPPEPADEPPLLDGLPPHAATSSTMPAVTARTTV